MQAGFQNSQQGFENIDRMDAGMPPKRHGKYFREANDPLERRNEMNDPTLPWHKEVAFLWNVEGKRMKFHTAESIIKAIESGDYFDSPAKAKEAKEAKLKAERAAIKEEIEMREKLAKLRAEENKPVKQKKKAASVVVEGEESPKE